MYIDHNILKDFPFTGIFYRTEVDRTLPLDEQVEKRVNVFTTPCDITESSHSWARNFIWAKYAVYFPFDEEKDTIEIQMGDMFESIVHGLKVNGKVVGVFPSQLGGVTVYVQDTDVDEK